MNKPIAFDLDGTLFQAHLLGVSAYRETFVRMQRAELIREIPEYDFSCLFGMTGAEIWKTLLPDAPEVREIAAQWMDEEEQKLLQQEAGDLYPGVLETLDSLSKQGHPLFVVSNGTKSYVKSVCRDYGLTPLLSGIYSAGEYKTETKIQLLGLAIQEHGLKPGLMVGDRSSDIDAGQANGFTAVGCTYGYGRAEELAHAHYIIDDIRQVILLAGKE